MAGRKGLNSTENPNPNSFRICEFNPKLSPSSPSTPPHEVTFRHSSVFFASVKHIGGGVKFNVSPTPSDSEKLDQTLILPSTNIGFCIDPESLVCAPLKNSKLNGKKRNKEGSGFKLKFKVSNPSLRRLISGAFAGAISRTAVAPLETIRTHLMVGSGGLSSAEVFDHIMKTDGWLGLFRGNFVNVIRVAPSKAIELFAYDTVKKALTPKPDEPMKLPIPPSLVAGACAGFTSTLCTYPLELLKTRLTIQRDVYNNLLDAMVKIVRDEGPGELYRGLVPSLIGVVPYAAVNYFTYDGLRKAYKKAFKTDPNNLATLLIGSMSGAISSSASFPLEVARKQMQVGAVGGRRVYENLLHALICIMEKEGVGGLYKGLGPSCLKLAPAAGIAFMCYEGCKKVLVEEDEKEE